MKVSQKKIDGNNVVLEAVASKEDVAKALRIAQEGFARSMGLQPDETKTVQQAIEERTGIKDLDSVVSESAVDLLITMALDRKNVVPAFLPEVKAKGALRRGEDFVFEIEATLKPEYELTSYEPVSIEAAPFEIDESEVDAEIERMTGNFTTYTIDVEADPDAEVQSGDFVLLSIDATQDGEALVGLNTDGRTYAVGAGHMPKGFDDQIIGMKVGEEKEFDFTGPSFNPDDETEEDRIHARVKVIEKQKEEKPVFDDAWVSAYMPMFSSANEMRESIRSSIEERARANYDAYLRQLAVAKLAERFEGKIDDRVYESMMSQLSDNIRADLQRQGKTWEDFVEQNGGESQVTMLLMMQARENIVQGYALDSVYRHFKLKIEDEDILKVCQTINPSVDPKVLRENVEQAGQGFALREMAERLKASDYVLQQASVVTK